MGAPRSGSDQWQQDSSTALLAEADPEGREGGGINPTLLMQRLRLPWFLSRAEKAWTDASLILNLFLGAAQNRCWVGYLRE